MNEVEEIGLILSSLQKPVPPVWRKEMSAL